MTIIDAMNNRSLSTLLLPVLIIVFGVDFAHALQCQLPINFTYFQHAGGHYCNAPSAYLESQYGGGSFSVDTNGVARDTKNPNVRFTIKEVATTASWNELAARMANLDPGVLANGGGDTVRTPCLFWDGRQDLYWYANAKADTITTQFKATVDKYIVDCQALYTFTLNDTSSISGQESKSSPTPTEDEDEAGCSFNQTETGQSTTAASTPAKDEDEDGSSLNAAVDNDESILCFVFFFSKGCPHCAKVKEYIDGDLVRNANVTFQYKAYDVHQSDYSRQLIAGYNYFGWTGTRVVPTIFIGDEDNMRVLVGEDAIFNELLPLVQEMHQQQQVQQTECYDFEALVQEEENLADASSLNWGVLTAAALVDSINPCAIAVLLILLSGLIQSVVPAAPRPAIEQQQQVHPAPPETNNHGTQETETVTSQEADGADIEPRAVSSGDEEMAAVVDEEERVMDVAAPESTSGDGAQHDGGTHAQEKAADSERQSRRRRAFLSGMAFISSLFISYYALGFGLFTAFSFSSPEVAGYILLALGVFIIILGIWNIKDYFFYDVGYNVEIPRSWRPLLKRVLGAVTSPLGAFAAGFLVCLFELPCTGGPYLFILGLLADKNTRTEAAFLLLYYNFIFVLPLIIINCLVFWGAAMLDKVGKWKEKYIRHLHLFAGLVLITLGVLAIVDSRVGLF